MSENTRTTVHVDAQGARLDVAMSATAPDAIHLRYRLHNTGDAPLAVFDRGDRQAVLSGRLVAGAVGAPTFQADGSDVVLRHAARDPAPGGFTGPTVPATPLALQLAPGAVLEGEFEFSIPTPQPPRRLRWCLGVAPFDEAGFSSPQDVAAGTLWQAHDAAVARQQMLCTPWWDLATGETAAD